MVDTLSANIIETSQEIIHTTEMMMPQAGPMVSLATPLPIPKGRNFAELPFVNSFPTVTTPTEGDEVLNSSQFDLSSTSIAPVERVMKVRVSKRAERFTRDQLIATIGEWLGIAQGKNSDEDLLAEFGNFHTDNDVGATTVDLTLDTLLEARTLLMEVAVEVGGPAPEPIVAVLSPRMARNLATDLGSTGNSASSASSPWIPEGLSQTLIRRFLLPLSDVELAGVSLFWDGYIVNDGLGDHTGAMFARRALYHAVSEDWDLETFKVDTFLGSILRVYADFNSGVNPYTRWGSTILADGK